MTKNISEMIVKKDAAVYFLRLVVPRNFRQAYATHVAPGVRHHNPAVEGDARHHSAVKGGGLCISIK